jgi:anthranilate phosphoribosyltransferase
VNPSDVAGALIAGQTPDLADMVAYWLATDAAQRPKAETVAVLAALSAAPPCAQRMQAFVRYIDESYEPIRLSASDRAVNIVGTGGGIPTFNISTTAAFVAAAAGASVLKSGSSAYSSAVGSADILAALGLGKAMPTAQMDQMLSQIGIAFAPASAYPALCRRLALASLPLPFKMIGRFVNGLGPLICPFSVSASVVGVATPWVFETIRSVSASAGRRILHVHAEAGVDELLSICPNRHGWAEGTVSSLDPLDLGLAAGSPHLLRGGSVEENAEFLQLVLRGKGPLVARETVALNAGAVLYAAGKADSITAGTRLALDCLRDGAAYAKLIAAQRFVRALKTDQQAA